ncbi:MAG: 4Fe-4S dicluster domain-containing protein, partial [Dehalococcoidia bacterium]|nr:4Fe-4S dicluster domain-containing protein [Dehalococcoidia bacterium]
MTVIKNNPKASHAQSTALPSYHCHMPSYLKPRFRVERSDRRCIRCQGCVEQCSFGAQYYDESADRVEAVDTNCVGCHRCVVFCPTSAIEIRHNPVEYRDNAYWRPEVIEDITRQAETGGVLITGMGNDKPW